MGLLDFLFKGSIPNENRTKPFHANANAAERKDWFARTRPWHNVDGRVIDAMVAKFGEDPVFEVFVMTSMKLNLVRQYEQITELQISAGPACLCSHIAAIVCSAASASGKQLAGMLGNSRLNRDMYADLVKDVLFASETAIFLDKNQVGAYSSLAWINMLLNKPERVAQYARQGLDVIDGMLADNPFRDSKIPAIRNADQGLTVMRGVLLEMLQSCEGRRR